MGGESAPARRVLRAHVTGRVQGVYFRAHTARHASSLGLIGYARNLPDGRVEVLAGGEPAAVEALLKIVAQGPPMAEVTGVSVTELDESALAGLAGFARE